MSTKNSPKSSIGLKTIDFMGSSFSLNFATLSGKFQTHLGGSITILMGIISIAAFVSVMSQYFDRSKPIVTTSSEKGPARLEFNLYREMLFSPIGLYKGQHYIRSNWERYVTIKAFVHKLVLNKTTHQMQVTPYLAFDYIPCSQSTDPTVRKFMDTADISNADLDQVYLCPDFRGIGDEYKVIDDLEKLEFKVANLNIYPCSLPNPADCATEREIIDMGADILPVTKLIETADFDNPIRNFMVKRYNELDPTLFKNLKFDLRNSKVVDDASRFSEPVIKTWFSEAFHRSTDYNKRDGSLYCHPLMIRAFQCPEYIRYNFQGTGDVGVIRRNYKKWTEMLGEFGGIIKVVSSTVFTIYAIYNMFMMKSYLGKVVIGSNQKDHKEALKLLRKQEKTQKVNQAKISAAQAKSAFQPSNSTEATQKEVLEEMLKTRTTVDNLISKLNTLELIEQVLFRGCEDVKKLIPLVLYQRAKEEVEGIKIQKKQKPPLVPLNNNQVTPLSEPNSQQNKKKKESASLKDSYNLLQQSTAGDPLRSIIDQYMLDYLENVFEGDPGAPGSNILERVQNNFNRKAKIQNNHQFSFESKSDQNQAKKEILATKLPQNDSQAPESDNSSLTPPKILKQPSTVIKSPIKVKSPFKSLIRRKKHQSHKGLELEMSRGSRLVQELEKRHFGGFEQK